MELKNQHKIAVIQHPPVFLNKEKSLEKAVELILESAKEGAKTIIFPETWFPGYPVWLDYAPNAGLWDYPPAKALFRILFENSIVIGDESFQKLSELAKSHKCLIVMGANEKVGKTLFNSILYFLSDGSFKIHRKLMPTYTERMVWGMGDGSTLETVEHDELKVGGLICWEHWMPLARAAMHSLGEDLHIAQWPMVKDLHITASKHYAFEGQCFVAAAGCVLSKKQMMEGLNSVIKSKSDEVAISLLDSIPVKENELLLKGGSCIIKPNSEFLVSPVMNEETILLAEIVRDEIIEGSLFLDSNGHYSRPDVFTLTVDTKPKSNVTFES